MAGLPAGLLANYDQPWKQLCRRMYLHCMGMRGSRGEAICEKSTRGGAFLFVTVRTHFSELAARPRKPHVASGAAVALRDAEWR